MVPTNTIKLYMPIIPVSYFNILTIKCCPPIGRLQQGDCFEYSVWTAFFHTFVFRASLTAASKKYIKHHYALFYAHKRLLDKIIPLA